jgi:hypothetical protein
MKKKFAQWNSVLIMTALMLGMVSPAQVRADDPIDSPEPAPAAEEDPEAVAEPAAEIPEAFNDNENTLEVDFSGSELPEDWEIGGSAELTGDDDIDPEGDGWLRLTGNESWESGYAVNTAPVSTENGLAFQFDFASWGGNGADGIAFFLMDGEVDMDDFTMGGNGGSLGYAQRSGVEGLSGGYVGIGLDEFGNFSDPGEGRNGGPGRDRDSVTVRGPGDGDEGYEFVASSGTIQEGLDVPNVPERPDQTGDLFRSVSLWFRPVESQFSLSLNLQTGADSEPQEIFQDLLLPGTAPASVRYGFTATSGGSRNYHEVRNLVVDQALYEPPADEPPAEEPPADEPPVEEPPAEEPPAEEPPAEEPPAEEPPAEEPPVEETPVGESSSGTGSSGNGAPPSAGTPPALIPVTGSGAGEPQFLIPVTGSGLDQNSCCSTIEFFIEDEVRAILPVLCGMQASLEELPDALLPGDLPQGYSLIHLTGLVLKQDGKPVELLPEDTPIVLGYLLELPLRGNNLLAPENFSILFWDPAAEDGQGAWEQLDTQISDDEIAAVVWGSGIFALVAAE